MTFPLFGGGAIIDSFLPIKASEAGNADTLDCFPDDQVVALSGSDISCADPIIASILGFDVSATPVPLPLSGFGEKYKSEMMVTTVTGTSVLRYRRRSAIWRSWPPPTCRCCCWARPAQAKKCSPVPCMRRAVGAATSWR